MSFRFLALLAFLVIGGCEPTPEPSVEPLTTTTTTSPTTIAPSSTPAAASDLAEEGQEQVAILKQINRVNEDGSYTFGYEAADGSFKIETRDVAGNVKGMFGFVDEGGELKRVSYSASNGTGFQSTGTPNIPPIVTPADYDTSTRISLLPSGVRTTTEGPRPERPALPVYIYKTTTLSPRPEVIQHIPRLRPTPASFSTEPTESAEITSTRRPTPTTLFARKSSTPHFITLKNSTPRSNDDSEDDYVEPVTRRPSVVQTLRPRNHKKVVISKRPVEVTTIHPILHTTRVYPVTIVPDKEFIDSTHDDVQRQVDSNSVTEHGLTASGTEDSPDVFGGGPSARPYPAAVYRALFNPIPQYQRILQASQLQNPGQVPGAEYQSGGPKIAYPPSGRGALSTDPRLAAQFQTGGPQIAYPPSGRGALSPDPRLAAQYQPGGDQIPYPQSGRRGLSPDPRPVAQYQPPTEPNSNYPPPYPIPDGRSLPPSSPAGPDPATQFLANMQRQYQGLSFPSGRGRIGVHPAANAYQDVPTAPDQQPLNDEQYTPQGPAPIPPRKPQTLPPISYNPAQGLSPSQNVPGQVSLQQRQPNPPYPYSQYQPPSREGTNFLMEQLLRMILGAHIQPQPQPPQSSGQNITPFQQALIAALGLQNGRFLENGYDPRYQAYQSIPYYPPPGAASPYSPSPYAPRYQTQPNFPDLYSYRNPYLDPNPYGNPLPFNMGYPPQPYQNQVSPQEALLHLLLGRGSPTPRFNPEIPNTPAGLDRSPEFVSQRPIQARPPGPAPSVFYGQRIPSGSNIVERSPSTTPRPASTIRQSKQGNGSRNVQILEQESSDTTATETISKSR